jgi:hypothetical protein
VASKPVPASSALYLGCALLPLRAFLGFTFCFAGLQKLANPRFLDAADPASIQSQLAGAARRSPVHALISPLAHVAVRPLPRPSARSPGWAVRARASARRPQQVGVGDH